METFHCNIHVYICYNNKNLPYEHFIGKYSECPPVYSLVVTLTEDDLRGQILGGAAQGPRPIGVTNTNIERQCHTHTDMVSHRDIHT